jgi:tRNA uridine 5-carboxymethylaminomethyl modification enzyme
MRRFDVVVIGAGHAGCEAALAAARMGCATALVTLDARAVARMSCNPAIGGLAKGHLVREIDALGGEMGRAIDATGIQFRLLNASRGPAVQAPRAQADKEAYADRMAAAIAATPGLTLIEGEAADLIVDGPDADGGARRRALGGVVLTGGETLATPCAVVTTGTFLRGLLHCGLESRPGGRHGERPATGLSAALARLGFPMGRLKTGTPPRVLRASVDFDRLARQPGDPEPVPFSFATGAITTPQVDCHITFTTPATHAVVRRHLDRSPLATGIIRSAGPRYCPSIEDKVRRFADRDRHQIFVEPEGRDHPWIYLNGVSTSLPPDAQVEMVRSIPGLERAEVARPGYAVEYDFVRPTACDHTLMTKTVEGLFLAGQINGTTGYEEAAALGLMAGINAALRARGRPPLVLGRSEAYIGVLVDDLVLKGTDEPYRMFTSRAEYRLLLDIDSADLRLTDHGRRAGLVDDVSYARFRERRGRVARFAGLLEGTPIRPGSAAARRAASVLGIRVQEPTTPALLLRRAGVDLRAVETLLGDAVPAGLTERERRAIAGRMRYAGYIERQLRDVERVRREEGRRIPDDFDYAGLAGLSAEVVEKLSRARPGSLAQAARISGVTPAALSLINVHLEKARRTRDRGALISGTPSHPR